MKKTIIALLTLVLLVCCLTGCQKENAGVVNHTAATDAAVSLDDYLTDVKAQSAAVKTSLEQDALTQTDMNQKSKELRDLWEGALTHLLEKAQQSLTEAEWTKLTAEQTAWEAERTAAVEAAGKDYEGGSMYALTVNREAAARAEERVYQLYERLK